MRCDGKRGSAQARYDFTLPSTLYGTPTMRVYGSKLCCPSSSIKTRLVRVSKLSLPHRRVGVQADPLRRAVGEPLLLRQDRRPVPRPPEGMRWGAHIGIIAAIVLSLVGLSIVVVMAARDARTTAAEVRESSAIWNAYQQARYSVVQEALLTQEYRLAASPEYEEQFGEAAADLAAALETVEQTGKAADRGTAARVRTTNAALIASVPGLVDAINAGRRGTRGTDCDGAAANRCSNPRSRPSTAPPRRTGRTRVRDWSPPSAQRPSRWRAPSRCSCLDWSSPRPRRPRCACVVGWTTPAAVSSCDSARRLSPTASRAC